MANQSVVPPNGQFPTIATSKEPLLAFRCAPAIKPYLAEDSTGSIIIDTILTNKQVDGAVPFKLSTTHAAPAPLEVTVSINNKIVGSASVPVNASGHEIPIQLTSLKPQKAAFEVTCTAKATTGGTSFSTTTSVQRLPNPTSGGATKMDMRTGAMLVRTSPGVYDSVFPLGFYTSFGGYIATNLSILNDIADRGCV